MTYPVSSLYVMKSANKHGNNTHVVVRDLSLLPGPHIGFHYIHLNERTEPIPKTPEEMWDVWKKK